MSDLAREREILRRMSFGEYDGDTEYDVDVYLWSPSSRRHLIIPASGGYGVELPSIYERELDDELDDIVSSSTPPLSHSYSESVLSDFAFPGRREMDKAGYTNFFTSGLVMTSQRVSHRIDGWLLTLREHLKAVVQRFKQS